ncbi:AAA domain-containing protein [Vibrio coralliilyticus]|uniref:AAA domain-containing protein n=2 Tax=Vibrio coralliilyticus TaxID=190893 RepID=A0AAP6ZQ21_9VIBR|nr:AAA domain-containing protein [Vibrio coralliilyticus]NOJ25332.1 AAA domain-containing protein [Vibrio coralliilyticus]
MDVFGFHGTQVQVRGYQPCNNPYVPLKDENYIFRRETVRDINNFLDCNFNDGLLIVGPTGCGKTSAIEQVCARLHIPVQAVTCGGSTEYMDLVGQWTLQNGSTVWIDGPLTKAMREGHVLILNEIDLVDPSELANLNAVLEGAPLVISQKNAEIVRPNPNFRLVATANSNGTGSDGMYVGVQRQNLAFLDRFMVIEVDYADTDIESAILEKITPNIPKAIREKMIELANKVRTVFKGEEDEVTELSVTFSTRTLRRWAIQTQRAEGSPNPLAYALNRALLNRCSNSEEKEAINTWAIALFGSDFSEQN